MQSTNQKPAPTAKDRHLTITLVICWVFIGLAALAFCWAAFGTYWRLVDLTDPQRWAIDLFAKFVAAAFFFLIYIIHDKKKRELDQTNLELQTEELQFRREMIGTPRVEMRVFKINDETLGLETTVLMTNQSRRTFCIPAVYIWFTAFAGRTGGTKNENPTDKDLVILPRTNEAFNANTVVQVGPDETEVFTRTDELDSKFVQDNPIITMNLIVYGADADTIGMRYQQGKARAAGDRNEWLKYAAVKAASGKNVYNVFTRCGPNSIAPKGTEIGEVYLLNDQGQPDEENTAKLRRMLGTVTAWGWQKSVDIVNASRESGKLVQ